MTPNQLPPLPEPDTHCFDDDTGKDVWSYTADQMHAYALAALAQQAQEPVAWLYVDTVGERYLCFSRPTGGGAITNLYATPPAPQVPAPDIDEAAIARMTKRGADAWAGVDAQSVRGGEQVPAQSPQPAVPVVSAEQIRTTVESIRDPDTVPAFSNGYYTLTPDELRRAILAMRPAVEPMTERHPLVVFAKECELGTYMEHETPMAARKAISAAKAIGITAKAEDAHQPTKEAEK